VAASLEYGRQRRIRSSFYVRAGAGKGTTA
jgi:hypothetical protein